LPRRQPGAASRPPRFARGPDPPGGDVAKGQPRPAVGERSR
jgi:hypothetical protein